MTRQKYWLIVFSEETWKEFIVAGGKVAGLPRHRWTRVQRIQIGDLLLCYVLKKSVFVGVLEVLESAYLDDSVIWKSDVYPARLCVTPLECLDVCQGIPVLKLRKQLTVFYNLSNPRVWSGSFRGAPVEWKECDATIILNELKQASQTT